MTEGVTLIVQLSESDNQTKMLFSVVHPTEEYAKQQEELGFLNGWGSVFDRLLSYLEKA
jgi:uncharacterized protein YndB with AHSA1/START domain